jgi:hypothetical protein
MYMMVTPEAMRMFEACCDDQEDAASRWSARPVFACGL